MSTLKPSLAAFLTTGLRNGLDRGISKNRVTRLGQFSPVWVTFFFKNVFLANAFTYFSLAIHKQCILSRLTFNIAMISLKTLHPGGIQTRVFCS
jgi:hypothetical protein